MQCVINYVVDSYFFEMCDVMVTLIVATSLSFFFYCHAMSPKCLETCDVTTYVTPTMSNLNTTGTRQGADGQNLCIKEGANVGHRTKPEKINDLALLSSTSSSQPQL
jgi:hypothetical protein